jgi:pimeloyl-ACP methyl ester carboxylesterase
MVANLATRVPYAADGLTADGAQELHVTAGAARAKVALMPSPLHHLVEGSGPAVVLLHAGVADLRMWDHQVAALSSDHRVVRCDLRGFGQSPLRADDSYSDAEDILALLDELGVAEFALVGASHGGGVALQVASAVPERVTRLVLLDAAAGVAEKTDAIRAVWAEEERLVSAEDIDGATELMVRTWLGPDADESARALVRDMQRRAYDLQLAAGDDVDDRELDVDLTRLTMPTTVVFGSHDVDWFADIARQLAGQLPDARLVELDWAGHLPSLERPGETSALVRDAVDGP